MGLLEFFGLKKGLAASPAVLEAMSDRTFSPFPLIATPPAAQRINAAYVEVQNAAFGWMYRTSPAAKRVIDYIARNVSQLGLKVYQRVSDDEREHRGDHPAAIAMRWPNADTPGEHFIEEMVTNFLVFGNAYALKFRAPGAGLSLVTLEPSRVGLVGRSHFAVEAYRIWRQDGSSFDVSPQDVLHWRAPNPDDPRKGESNLETLRLELAVEAATRQALSELMRSGLSLNSWIERPLEAPELSLNGLQRLQEDLANQAKQGTRRPPILEEGMQLKQGGVSPEDAELVASRRFSAEYIASLYGLKNVPPEGEEERRQFYVDAIAPLTEKFAAFLNLHILQREFMADDHYFEFNLDEKLIGDDRLKALTSAAGAPPLTRNEARARLNLPAKEGGDELITPLNVTVGGKPSPQVMPVQNPTKPPQDGSHRTEDTPTPPGKSLNGHHKAHLIERRARADRNRNHFGQKYEGTMTHQFRRQRNSIRGKNLSQTKALKALEDPKWDKDLAAALNQTSSHQFAQAGKAAGFRANIDFDPIYGTNWLATKAQEAAADINQATREQIREQGITDAFAYAIGTRAAGLGKGYASDVAAFATKVAGEQTSNPEERNITITGGSCELCAPYQGTFPLNDVPGWPGFHPSCECIAELF